VRASLAGDGWTDFLIDGNHMLTNLRHQPSVHSQLSYPRREAAVVARSDWRLRLPVLTNGAITLRELKSSDASTLLDLLTNEEVARFISPPPTTVEGFERFIAWAQRERAAGRYICFALVVATPRGADTAVGIFQVRQLEPSFGTAEWGFAIGRAFWGTGAFAASARLTINFAFDVVGVHRLEARAAIANGRGNGALAKLGAVREATLRRSFSRGGRMFDQALWSIVRDDWRRMKAVWGAPIH
jgi:RimJ/RimL family protein N-acetyltransferase